MNITTTEKAKQYFLEIDEELLEVNEKGFLINFDDWNEDFAKITAKEDKLKLSDCHWKAIFFLRDFYREYEVAPPPRIVTKAIGEQISSWGCTNKDLEKAFPLGGCKQACRLAGLPVFYCHSC